METLERAQREDFDIVIHEGQFVITNTDDRTHRVFKLLPQYSGDSQTQLDNLVAAVDGREAATQEAKRVAIAKQTALAKLAPFELELLGLTRNS